MNSAIDVKCRSRVSYAIRHSSRPKDKESSGVIDSTRRFFTSQAFAREEILKQRFS
jgi:hypothetical protein